MLLASLLELSLSDGRLNLILGDALCGSDHLSQPLQEERVHFLRTLLLCPVATAHQQVAAHQLRDPLRQTLDGQRIAVPEVERSFDR